MRAGFRFAAASVVCAIAAMAASSLGWAAYADRCAAEAERDAHELEDRALPSVQQIEIARAELRRTIDDLVPHVHNPSAAPRDTTALKDALARYWALPPCEGEERLRPAAAAAASDLLTEVDRASTNAGDSARLATAAAALDRSLLDIVSTDLRHARSLSGRMSRARDAWRQRASLLTVASIVLGSLAAAVALVSMRRYARAAELRADELETFASRVAHDVIAPLAGTKMVLGFTQRRVGDDDTQRMLRFGVAGVDRAQRIVDALLAFARAGAHPDPDDRADVRAVVDDVVTSLHFDAEAARARIVVDPFESTTVACKPGVLTSMLTNLAQNALKYMGDAEERTVRVRVLDAGTRVRVEVEDGGPGLDWTRANEVFSPYVRGGDGKAPGIGLGLATVRRMAEAHGGAVGVRPRRPRGSVFWFEVRRGNDAKATRTSSGFRRLVERKRTGESSR